MDELVSTAAHGSNLRRNHRESFVELWGEVLAPYDFDFSRGKDRRDLAHDACCTHFEETSLLGISKVNLWVEHQIVMLVLCVRDSDDSQTSPPLA